jgi:hypothetical protein
VCLTISPLCNKGVCGSGYTLVIKAKFLTRVTELRDLIEMFVCEKGSVLLQHFIDQTSVISLVYLTEHFTAGHRSGYFVRKGPVISREDSFMEKQIKIQKLCKFSSI